MARIKYIDDKGEHNGTLTPAEYYIYNDKNWLYRDNKHPKLVMLEPTDRIPYFSWQNTDYEPFKRAVNSKYKTTCSKAWLV